MTPIETVEGNLSSLKRASGRLAEKRLYEFSELASVLFAEIGEEIFSDETAALLRQSRTVLWHALPLDTGTPPEYLPLFAQKDDAEESLDLSALSSFLAERIRREHADAFPWEEKQIGARVAYVPTVTAEEAYFALSAKRADASVLYADNTRGATELVLSGRADYALVPYATADGEPLAGVFRLLTEGDLLLSALVFVPREEGRLTYALLSDRAAPFVSSADMRITLRLTAKDHAHLGRMLAAFPTFGYGQTDLLPEREEYGRVCARVTLAGDGDPVALWIYLSFYSVGFSFLGRYPLIEL